jgi:chromosome partitioning protein
MHRVRTVAVMNQKGGVGKTTTVANLSAALARRGQSVWALDLDPQCHLSLHFDVDPTSPATLYEVLVDELAITEAARTVGDRLTVLPGSVDLAGVETELAAAPGRERRLANQLTSHVDADVVLIDCPPSLGLLTLNALAAADEVLIPLQPHFLALQGLGQLLQTVSLVYERINPRLSTPHASRPPRGRTRRSWRPSSVATSSWPRPRPTD